MTALPAPPTPERDDAEPCVSCSQWDGEQDLARVFESLDALRTAVPGEREDLASVRAGLDRDLQHERGWLGRLRSVGTARRIALSAALATAVPAAAWLALPRADAGVYPPSRFWLELSTLGLLLGGALALVLRPLHRPGPPPVLRAVWLSAGVALPFLLSAAPIAHSHHPQSLGGVGADLWPMVLHCAGRGLAFFAAPLALVLAALDRGAQRSRFSVLGAGVAAGLAGHLAVHLTCPLTTLPHLLLAHAPLAALGGVTWLALVAAARRFRLAES